MAALASPKTQSTLQPAKVLIVDDSEPSLKLMTYELEKAGFLVSTAGNGRQGLARAREDHPDLILLDVLMPEMDGFETCRLLKASAELASIPVLMWTSLDSTGDIVRGLEAGAQDYVTKPFVPAVLRARIDAALRAKRFTDELRRSNEALEKSQRAAHSALNVRNEFLSHVSHELRTPLTSVHQFLSILTDGLAGDLTEEQSEFVEIAFRNAKQLRSMIGDLMDVTRLQNGKMRVAPRPFDLPVVIGEIIRSQQASAAAGDIRLHAEVDSIPEVLGDEVRVRQVVGNLIHNAIKFTPEGGEIRVHVSHDPEQSGMVRVGVHDNGCGVSPDALDRIFHYMQQEEDDDWRSRKGLGIGLYICRELVTRQGGRIWVESEQGKGSSFLFTLPEFDLGSLVQPAVVEDQGLREACSLIRVDLQPGEGSGSKALSDAVSRRAYHRVKTSLLERDVLLPRFLGGDFEETYFVVAGTGEKGMESLCRRIQGNLKRERGIDEEGFCIDVRGRVLETQGGSSEDLTGRLNQVAEEIHRLTQTESNWGD